MSAVVVFLIAVTSPPPEAHELTVSIRQVDRSSLELDLRGVPAPQLDAVESRRQGTRRIRAFIPGVKAQTRVIAVPTGPVARVRLRPAKGGVAIVLHTRTRLELAEVAFVEGSTLRVGPPKQPAAEPNLPPTPPAQLTVAQTERQSFFDSMRKPPAWAASALAGLALLAALASWLKRRRPATGTVNNISNIDLAAMRSVSTTRAVIEKCGDVVSILATEERIQLADEDVATVHPAKQTWRPPPTPPMLPESAVQSEHFDLLPPARELPVGVFTYSVVE